MNYAWKDYLKAIATAIVTGVATVVTALDDDSISNVEWLAAVVAVCGSTGVVWYVTNGPGGMYAKSIFAGISTAAGAAIIALQDNALSTQELLTIAIAVAGSLGIVAALPGPRQTTPMKSGQ
jgi:hypothetical protein